MHPNPLVRRGARPTAPPTTEPTPATTAHASLQWLADVTRAVGCSRPTRCGTALTVALTVLRLALVPAAPAVAAVGYWYVEALRTRWFVALAALFVAETWIWVMPDVTVNALKRRPTLEDLEGRPHALKVLRALLHVLFVAVVTLGLEYLFHEHRNNISGWFQLGLVVYALAGMFGKIQLRASNTVLALVMRLYGIDRRRWAEGDPARGPHPQVVSLCEHCQHKQRQNALVARRRSSGAFEGRADGPPAALNVHTGSVALRLSELAATHPQSA